MDGGRSGDHQNIFIIIQNYFNLFQACFKQTFPVVTLYTNLGEDAIVHAINQTEVEIVITTHELLPKFKTILSKTPKVACLIFMEDQIHETDRSGYKSGVQIVGYKEVVQRGEKSCLHPTLPEPSDPAIIMYTSGSTGIPKGRFVFYYHVTKTLHRISIKVFQFHNI